MIYVAALAALLVLTACGSDTGEPSADETPAPTPTAMPTEAPVPDGPVTTRYEVTVLDDGGGAELCLGGVATSLPPQCDGPRLVGWDWADHVGDFEDVRGTKWGDFAVKGTFDGADFTDPQMVPTSELDPPAYEQPDFSTPCPEPESGWPVPDESDDNMAATDRAFRRASQLDDYSTAWLDRSGDERTPEQLDSDLINGVDHVSGWIINVRVTRDVAAAEAAIREVWTGPLCVTTGEHTEREQRRIQREGMRLPGVVASGGGLDGPYVNVIFDDGTLQAWADQEFGEGVLRVDSALEIAE